MDPSTTSSSSSGSAVVALFVVAIIAFFFLILILKSIRVVKEYERGVIFRLGRCVGAKGPGVFFIVPGLDKLVRCNLQVNAVPVQPQQVITKDNVTVTVDAVAYMQVIDPAASVVRVRDWYTAAQLVSQTTLRSIVGRHELDQMLSERDLINSELQGALDNQTEAWGVKVSRVEIRDVVLPEQMQRAMARQAEAERERRAKVTAAQGEFEASVKLAQAAEVIAREPAALQLRQLQTMVEISAEKNSTIIFPIPVELLAAFDGIAKMGNSKVSLASEVGAGPASGPSASGGSTPPPAAPPAAP
ncbi:MAG: slipin family protein [Acidimicrobiia bacterium]